MNKDEIRPLYATFIGFLSQTPLGQNPQDTLYDSALWEQYNATIKQLNSITQKNYDEFIITSKTSSTGGHFIRIATLRVKLGALISRLHSEYFVDDPPPFSGSPSTIITQSQNQTQNISIQILLDTQKIISEKMPQLEEGSKEKTFFQKLQGSLSSIKSIGELLSTIMTLAGQCGLDIKTLTKLFS
jgi:hypothetical protein